MRFTKKLKIVSKIRRLAKLSKIIKAININGPLMVNLRLNSSKLSGKIANKILEPSSGGIGIRLKTPKIRLINIKNDKKITNKLLGPKLGAMTLNIIMKIKTLMKLDKGPAKDTAAPPQRRHLRL